MSAWPAPAPRAAAEDLLGGVLEQTATALGAARLVVAWEESAAPFTSVVAWGQGELERWNEPAGLARVLAPPSLAGQPFLVLPPRRGAGAAEVRHANGTHRWGGEPGAEWLRERFGHATVLSLPLGADGLTGRLLSVLAPPGPAADELARAAALARPLAGYLLRQSCLERAFREALSQERARFASDLHDGVVQALAAAALRLESARQLMPAGPEAAVRVVEEVQDLLLQEQRELRDMIAFLEPREPTDAGPGGGWAERLAALVERMGRHWDLRVEVRDDLAAQPPDEGLGHELLRILQEALVNASRHGRAKRAQVELRPSEGGVWVSITDDGCGFPFRGRHDFAALTEGKLGPVSLKRRIAALGGRLEITSDGTGARVEVELPLPPTGGRDADPRGPG